MPKLTATATDSPAEPDHENPSPLEHGRAVVAIRRAVQHAAIRRAVQHACMARLADASANPRDATPTGTSNSHSSSSQRDNASQSNDDASDKLSLPGLEEAVASSEEAEHSASNQTTHHPRQNVHLCTDFSENLTIPTPSSIREPGDSYYNSPLHDVYQFDFARNENNNNLENGSNGGD